MIDQPQKRLTQFRSLERLRDLKKTQAATRLAERNKALSQAIDACQQAEALYRQALDILRKNRRSGATIDPLLYAHQLEAADGVKQTLLERTAARDEVSTQQRQAVDEFADQHAKHKVAATAVDNARADLRQTRQMLEALETQDQTGRNAYMKETP